MIAIWKGRRRRLFAALVSAAMLQALLVVVGAWCVRHLFDGLAGAAGAQGHFIAMLAIGLAAAAIAAFGAEVVQRRLGEELALDYVGEVRFALFEHHIRTAGGRLTRPSQGAVLMPFVGDLTALRSWVGNGLARLCVAATTLALLLAAIASYSLRLAAAIVIALTIGGLMLLFLGVLLEGSVREVRRRRGALASHVSDRLPSIAAIRLMGRAKSERRKVAARTAELNRASRRRAWISGAMRGTAQLTGSLLILATLLVGIAAGPAQPFTPGVVVATLSLVGLMAGAINDLGRALETWYPGRISSDRIAAILRRPVRRRGSSVRHASPEPGLIIADLALKPFAEPLSVRLAPGDVVLLQGPAGAGKTSLLNAIAQLAEPEGGAVFHNRRDLRALSARALRSLVGFASPELALLRGSVGMNLRYRAPNADPRQIDALVASSGLGIVAERLPDGMATRLDHHGSPLSLGERQALLIARATLGSPALLLIDSVDTHLPEATLQWLARHLRSYPGIVLMAVSQPALEGCANRIWRLGEGRLSEIAVPYPAAGRVVVPLVGQEKITVRKLQ